MSNWRKILINSLKILLIVIMIGLSSACGKNDDSSSENSLVACDAESQKTCEENEKELSDEDCLGCQIFKTMFEAVNQYYKQMQTMFSEGAKSFMMVAFAIWLALRLLKYVSSVTENNMGEVWNEIIRKAFLCVLCTLIVSSTATLNAFVNTFIMPIYMAFLELGVKILGASTSSEVSSGTLQLFGEQVAVGNTVFSCSAFNNIEFKEEGLPEALLNTIKCMLEYLRDNLSLGGKIGMKAMSHSFGFIGGVLGLCLFCCFLIVKICFVFYLVDSMFKLGIILFMLPIFVMAFAFGPTKAWATKAFSYIISTAAFLMCFSVIVALSVRAMIELIRGNEAIFNQGEMAFEDLSVGFMMLMLIGFLITGSSGVASQLTNSWVGGSVSSNFQKKLKGMVQGAAQTLWKGVTALATFGAAAFPNMVVSRGITAIKKIDNKIKSVQKAAGR